MLIIHVVVVNRKVIKEKKKTDEQMKEEFREVKRR